LDTIGQVKGRNKTPLFLDPDNNAFTFLKYKGQLIDLSEYCVNEQLKKTTRKDS